MLEKIPNIIAKRHGLNLSGKRNEIIRDGRMVKVIWFIDNGTFTFYSNGDWDINDYEGEYKEGHTNPPTQKIWIKRMLKNGMFPQMANAAWYEWVALKSHSS